MTLFNIVLGLWAGLSLCVALLARWYYTYKLNINDKAFTNVLQKLIMANNIDRAVKLCNAEPEALLPKVIKPLLLRANRPYSLLLAHHEGLVQVRVGTVHPHKLAWRGQLVSLAGLVAFAVALLSGLPEPTLVTPWLLLLLFVSRGLSAMTMSSLVGLRDRCELSSVRVLALLCARAKYMPPSFKPRDDFTDEELAEWRAGIEWVESEAVKAGPKTASKIYDYNEESDGRVKPDGVLPAL